jgi:hypothetical protein
MARQRKSDAAVLTAAAPEPEELAADFPLERPAAAATTPGGMVRISKGDQQRCIWPVHLSGWQQLGWTVLGGQGAEPQVAEPRAAGRRHTKPEPLIEPLSAIDSFDPLEPLHPPLDPAQELDPLAWDDTTTEQP